MWLIDTWRLGARANLEGGVRVDRAGINNDTTMSPRLAASIVFTPRWSLRAAVGQYTQSPGYEKAAQSDYVLDFTSTTARSLQSERAQLASLGLEQVIGRGLSLRVAGQTVTTATTIIQPAYDGAGRLIYTVNYGGVPNLNNARLPDFARVDVRTTWKPRGATGRWEFYLEVINILNRKNAGALTAELAYDPTSDRPTIVEQADQSIPRLPTLGLRWRF